MKKYNFGFQTNNINSFIKQNNKKLYSLSNSDFGLKKYPKNNDIISYWDTDNFQIFSKNENSINELIEASNNNNLIIETFNSDVFQLEDLQYQNYGLCLIIKDRLPKEIEKELIEEQKTFIKIYEEVKKSNIKQILEKTDKKYMALSPKFDNNGELIFWLNPENQQKYNYGWFNINDLIDWSKNKGKIIKNNLDKNREME